VSLRRRPRSLWPSATRADRGSRCHRHFFSYLFLLIIFYAIAIAAYFVGDKFFFFFFYLRAFRPQLLFSLRHGSITCANVTISSVTMFSPKMKALNVVSSRNSYIPTYIVSAYTGRL